MTTKKGCFTGHDGLHLFEQSWIPTERPRAAVVLIHGLIEHSGQHADTAQELVRHGFSVHAMDLRGHGRSEGPRCDVRSFDQYLLDLDIFFARTSREAGDRPLFVMGNSMGGLLITLWAIQRQPQISGLILSGPLLALADDIYPRLRHFATVTAAVAPALRVARIPFDRLARKPQVVDRFRDDPLVFQGCFTVRMAAEILRAMKKVSEQAAALSVPLLILHGSQDRICGSAGSLALFEKAGCADKTLHLYEGFYHEVFDEPERDRVLTDLVTWLDQHVPTADVAACRKQMEA
ncbi:MAG: lysophospholipase [Thermoguttaceae bacterium]|jgi:alpha-beta hydrolase superfamily lysophospholipase